MFHVKHSIDILILYSSLHPRVFLQRVFLQRVFFLQCVISFSTYLFRFDVLFFRTCHYFSGISAFLWRVFLPTMRNFSLGASFSLRCVFFLKRVILSPMYQSFFGISFFLQRSFFSNSLFSPTYHHFSDV